MDYLAAKEREGLARIQHVTITVPANMISDVEAFYRTLGGVPLVRPPALVEDTPGSWLGFGETQLHLITGEPVPEPAHFALHLGDSFDSVLRDLRNEGHTVKPARDLWGGRRRFVQDPAGNRLELFDVPPQSVPKWEATPAPDAG